MNEPVKQPVKQPISTYLTSASINKTLEDSLGSKKEVFITNLVSLMSQRTDLSECTNISIMSGALVATSLNLSLNKSFGYAYLIPFKNNKKGITEAQFQVGYKGYIQLALRTAQYRKLNAVTIYKNQIESWNPLEEELILNDEDGYGDVAGYVAFFELLYGFKKMMYWSHEKMLNHADKYSSAFNRLTLKEIQNGKVAERDMWKYSSFWYQDFNEMALKTMLRQVLSKYGILSEEMETAYDNDFKVIEDGKARYVDVPENLPREDVVPVVSQADPLEEETDKDIPMGKF